MKHLKRITAIVLALVVITSAFAACSFSQESKLKGAWRDSTGFSGYEFMDNNVCKITYADVTIPIVNIKYDGSIDGSYTVTKKDDGNYYVTITFTVIAQSVSQEYMFNVDGDTLTLTSFKEDGTVLNATTYLAYTPVESTVAPSSDAATQAVS